MIPGLALVEKIVTFAIDFFVKNQLRNQELKENFAKFFKKTGSDSQESTRMHDEYKKFKGEKEWKQ